MSNALENFAEHSEACFDGDDLYPFARRQTGAIGSGGLEKTRDGGEKGHSCP